MYPPVGGDLFSLDVLLLHTVETTSASVVVAASL